MSKHTSPLSPFGPSRSTDQELLSSLAKQTPPLASDSDLVAKLTQIHDLENLRHRVPGRTPRIITFARRLIRHSVTRVNFSSSSPPLFISKLHYIGYKLYVKNDLVYYNYRVENIIIWNHKGSGKNSGMGGHGLGKGSYSSGPGPRHPAHLEQANLKVPPAWSPEFEAHLPVHHWARDISLWSLATDLPVGRQGPAAVLQLGGLARALAREMDEYELVQGRQEPDPATGQPVMISGLAILVRQMLRKFGSLDEKRSILAIANLLGFQRLHNENIDAILARFDLIVYRASSLASFVMGNQGLVWLLMSALHIQPFMWMQFLQLTGGRLPDAREEFDLLRAHIRRQTHLLEQHPHNIA